MLRNLRPCLILVVALGLAGRVLAEDDPTLSQVYEAARTGHPAHAQEMMKQVLRDHPKSAKAHYVMAELYADQGDRAMAQQELNTAEQLKPGLPFAKPESVRTLQGKIAQTQLMHAQSAAAQRYPSFLGVALIILAVGGGFLWLILRRRNSVSSGYTHPPGALLPAPATSPNPGGATFAPGGGIGTGVVGGLASGLAVGAGVVAGEEIARHLFDSRRQEGAPLPIDQPAEPHESNDLGGNDFGVTDDNSWDDDDGPGGDSSGDDWN